MHHGAFARHWKEIALSFLKLGATAYGGPAVTGLIQTELQEKRQWVSKPRFIEGIALINLLPGAGLVQLSTFLGYARGGWWGGLLAGLCFALPGFGIMFAFTLTYAYLGATPTMRAGLNGLGPVVLGIFMLAVYRLGRASATTIPKFIMAIMAMESSTLLSTIRRAPPDSIDTRIDKTSTNERTENERLTTYAATRKKPQAAETRPVWANF